MMRWLRKIIGKAKLSYDEIHSAIVEVEAVIKSHPFIFLMSEDVENPGCFLTFWWDTKCCVYPIISLTSHQKMDALKVHTSSSEKSNVPTKQCARALLEMMQKGMSAQLERFTCMDKETFTKPLAPPVNIGGIIWFMIKIILEDFFGRFHKLRNLLRMHACSITFQRLLQLIYPLAGSECHSTAGAAEPLNDWGGKSIIH